MLNRKGQTILEYTVIAIVMMGVLMTMQNYLKRGVQGRLKSATDNFGEQYDPQNVNSLTVYSTLTNSQSVVTVINGVDNLDDQLESGQWTNRLDASNSQETKTGYTQVGN